MFIWQMPFFNLTPFDMVRVHLKHLSHGKKCKCVCRTRAPEFSLDVNQSNYTRYLPTVEISATALGAVAGRNNIVRVQEKLISKHALFY